MVASLIQKIKGTVVKTVPNQHIGKFPNLTEVLKPIHYSEITRGSYICDNVMIYQNEEKLIVGKKQIYNIIDCRIQGNYLLAKVKTAGVILFQDMFINKKVILNVFQIDDRKSQKNTLVTGYFDEDYIWRFPETLFFKNKVEDKNWKLFYGSKVSAGEKVERPFYSFEKDLIKGLVQTTAHMNCEFKVK
ncbi:MAG: hypothetical protein WC011_03235 [Candidatus Paceibacterota bacterium]